MKLQEHKWVIYLLFDQSGTPDYVGSSNNIKRRLNEHKKVLGYKPRFEILEEGIGLDRHEAETRWIKHCLSIGIVIRNVMTESVGGRFICAESTRKKISAAHKGKKRPPGWGERIGAVTRGKPHDLTPETRDKIAKTQFKPGYRRTEEAEQKRRDGVKSLWDAIPSDQRSAMSTERNNGAWARRSKKERSIIGKKIAQTRAKNFTTEQLSEIASRNAKAALADPDARARLSSQVKNWWASLTSEARSDYLMRRTAKIVAAKTAKKIARSTISA